MGKKEKKMIMISVRDGMLRAIILWLLLDFWYSKYVTFYPITIFLMVCGIIFSCLGAYYTFRYSTNVLVGFSFSILSFCIMFILICLLPIPKIFPLRDQSPGDYLIVPGYIGGFIIVTNVFRVLLLILRSIKIIKDCKGKKGGGRA